jgi:citrate synthase
MALPSRIRALIKATLKQKRDFPGTPHPTQAKIDPANSAMYSLASPNSAVTNKQDFGV